MRLHPVNRSASHDDRWHLVRLLRAALALSVLRKPGVALPTGQNAAPLLLAACVVLLVGLLVDDVTIAPPREANVWALTERLVVLPLLLLFAWLLERLGERRRVLLPLATTGLLALAPALALWPTLQLLLPEDSLAVTWIPASYIGLMALQATRWTAVQSRWWRQSISALLVAGGGFLAYWLIPESPWFWETDWEDETELTDALPFSQSAEAVWNDQHRLMQAQLSALAADDPAQIDLYAIGVAGDGSETVFHNEVRYFERLMNQRLSRPGHVLSLINHPLTADSYPLASMSNLRSALAGVAAAMNVEQDILLLFITSHGSSEHEVLLGMGPLPLDQMQPQNLRQALDDSGIRWRVLVISACYSGGYIDALQSPDTLVITAARHDRSSFGCGAQSDVTWFGQAFLVEALNESIDFVQAFASAKQQIRLREKQNDQTASHPQIVVGSKIAKRLNDWRAQQRPGPPVAFSPPDLLAERLKRMSEERVADSKSADREPASEH